MLWIGLGLLPQDGSRKVPTTAPYNFVDQLNTARRFMWNKATKVRCTVDAASHIYRWRYLLWWFLLASMSQKISTIALSSVPRAKSWRMYSRSPTPWTGSTTFYSESGIVPHRRKK